MSMCPCAESTLRSNLNIEYFMHEAACVYATHQMLYGSVYVELVPRALHLLLDIFAGVKIVTKAI